MYTYPAPWCTPHVVYSWVVVCLFEIVSRTYPLCPFACAREAVHWMHYIVDGGFGEFFNEDEQFKVCKGFSTNLLTRMARLLALPAEWGSTQSDMVEWFSVSGSRMSVDIAKMVTTLMCWLLIWQWLNHQLLLYIYSMWMWHIVDSGFT